VEGSHSRTLPLKKRERKKIQVNPRLTIIRRHVNRSTASFRFPGLGCLSARARLHGEEFVAFFCCEAVLNKLQCHQGMTAFYGNFDRDAQEAESLKTIATALELGINLLDTAWIYQVCCCIANAATSKLLMNYVLRHDCTVPEP
jgi:hypothetical protein